MMFRNIFVLVVATLIIGCTTAQKQSKIQKLNAELVEIEKRITAVRNKYSGMPEGMPTKEGLTLEKKKLDLERKIKKVEGR